MYARIARDVMRGSFDIYRYAIDIIIFDQKHMLKYTVATLMLHLNIPRNVGKTVKQIGETHDAYES